MKVKLKVAKNRPWPVSYKYTYIYVNSTLPVWYENITTYKNKINNVSP
jgi:hypothetical protein